MIIDTQRPDLWATLSNGGIPDLLIINIDNEPDPNTCLEPDGSLGGPTWFETQDEWMDQVMATAMNVAALPQLQARLDELEYLRDRLARELASRPLPQEPLPSDYLASHPAYEGEYNDLAYRWDHQAWQSAFIQRALNRDATLTKLVANKPDDATAPEPLQSAPAQQPTATPAAGGARVEPPRPDVTVSIGFSVNGGRLLSSGFPFTEAGGTPASPGMTW